MKREAVGHTKMKPLCRRLDLPLWQGVGLLESIWHLTAREAPRGDIGKLSDEDIALAIDYRGDESNMIEALVVSGWLERDPVDRLIVHDWWEHADDAVQARLARTKRYFVRGHSPKLTKLSAVERTVAAEFYRNTKAGSLPEPEPEPVISKKPCASPVADAQLGERPSILLDAASEPLGPVSAPSPSRASAQNRDLSGEQENWFAQWWQEYWVRRAKKAAREAFRRHVKTPARFEQVMSATRAQKPEMLSREANKRPHGATWLNGERWEDETTAGEATQPAETIWSEYPEYTPLGRSA